MIGTDHVGDLFVGPANVSDGLEALLASSNRTLLLIALGAGLGAVLIAAGLSRRILRPVGALTEAAGRMSAGDLGQRVNIASRDEIGELAQAFNQMADGLERQEHLRRNMVSDVAHELRTPLTNIRGYLQAVSEGVIEPSEDVIASLLDEAVHLASLVDDLQDLSLADARQLSLDFRPSDICAVIQRTTSPFRSRAEKKGVRLGTDCSDELPLVCIDSRRIAQVLRNLLENALTHTPEGGTIAVSARSLVEATTRPGNWVEVCVSDTGTGIAPHDLPRVFDRFYRADHSRTRATGGSGLGLAIAKQFVEAHGGQISVSSTPGAGSSFRFTLPRADPERI